MNNQNYFIVCDTTEGAYLCLNDEGNGLLTFSTERKASDAFELHYHECHQMDITWSTSAAIHWLSLKPFIIALDGNLSPVEVINALNTQAPSGFAGLTGQKLTPPTSSPDPTVYSLHSIAVRSIKGLKVDLDSCRKYEVSSVRLIAQAPAA